MENITVIDRAFHSFGTKNNPYYNESKNTFNFLADWKTVF